MAVMLYYPRIVPPQETLHQALLYWDGIGSIVPSRQLRLRSTAADLRGLPPLSSRGLKEAQEHGLYHPVEADPLLPTLECRGSRGQDPYGVELLDQALRDLSARHTAPPETAGHAVHTDSFIYHGKLAYSVVDRHRQLRLAKSCSRGLGWRVSPAVHHLLIGTMARSIAHRAGEEAGRAFLPCTESPEAHRLAYATAPDRPSVRCWEVELGRLLPLPSPETRTREVITFRRRYDDERIRLMRSVHRLLGDLRLGYEHPGDVLA